MSVTGGRRPALTRGVFAIEQEQLALPDPLALDTSFVVEALLATQLRFTPHAAPSLRASSRAASPS